MSIEGQGWIKTTFKLGSDKYCFNVLPMGFRNASNIFQRQIEHLLSDLIDKI